MAVGMAVLPWEKLRVEEMRSRASGTPALTPPSEDTLKEMSERCRKTRRKSAQGKSSRSGDGQGKGRREVSEEGWAGLGDLLEVTSVEWQEWK